ncbi:MAG: hypothetical protein ACQEVA_07555 [Myxococcota bacterium]
MASACATGPDLGARSGYSGATVPKITVAPFYASSNFGASQQRIGNLLALAELSAQRALETYGYRVVSPAELRDELESSGVWQDYVDGVLLREDLERHFEPEPRSGEVRLESQRLAQLGSELPTRYMLFGQLIYHTSTTCRVDPVEHQPLATIEPENATLPAPCAISHLAFKLVDAETGETMWFNKVFLETRGSDGDKLARQNISRAVAGALVGERGLPRYFQTGTQ